MSETKLTSKKLEMKLNKKEKGLTEAQKHQKVTVKSLYRGEWKEKTQQLVDIYALISSSKYSKQVGKLREELLLSDLDSVQAFMEDYAELPTVHMPTGMVVLHLPVDSLQQLEQVRQRVVLFPQTLMTFQSADGRHLVVVMCYELSDGTLPSQQHDVRLFRQYAYRRAADFVLASTGVKAAESRVAPGRRFHMSSDERATWNEAVVAVRMEQPTEELTELTATIMPPTKGNPLAKDVLPGYSQLEMDIVKFNAVCRKLAFSRHHALDEYLLAVAQACSNAGIDQEVATKCLLSIGDNWQKEVLIRSTMENGYQKHRYGLKSPIEPTLMHQQLMKDYCSRLPMNKVICYCHYCLEGLLLGNADAHHIAQLLFPENE